MSTTTAGTGWMEKLGGPQPSRARSTIQSEFSESDGESDFSKHLDAGRTGRSSGKHQRPVPPLPPFPEAHAPGPTVSPRLPSQENSAETGRAARKKLSPSTPPSEAGPRREFFDSSSTSSTIPTAARQPQVSSPVLEGSVRNVPFDESEDDLAIGFMNDPLTTWRSLCEASAETARFLETVATLDLHNQTLRFKQLHHSSPTAHEYAMAAKLRKQHAQYGNAPHRTTSSRSRRAGLHRPMDGQCQPQPSASQPPESGRQSRSGTGRSRRESDGIQRTHSANQPQRPKQADAGYRSSSWNTGQQRSNSRKSDLHLDLQLPMRLPESKLRPELRLAPAKSDSMSDILGPDPPTASPQKGSFGPQGGSGRRIPRPPHDSNPDRSMPQLLPELWEAAEGRRSSHRRPEPSGHKERRHRSSRSDRPDAGGRPGSAARSAGGQALARVPVSYEEPAVSGQDPGGAPVPANDAARQAAVKQLQLHDGRPDEARKAAQLQHLCEVTCRLLHVSAAGASLVLGSEVTVAAAGMPLLRCAWRDSMAVWTMAPTLPEILVIPDARADPRVATSPMVTGSAGKAPMAGFCAAAPLVASCGHRVGALCIYDTKPRQLAADEAALLANMAELVVRCMEQHVLLSRRSQVHTQSRRMLELGAPIAIIDTGDTAWTVLYANSAWLAAAGRAVEEVEGRSVWEWCQPQRDAALLLAKRARDSAAFGTGFQAPVRFQGAPASLNFLPACCAFLGPPALAVAVPDLPHHPGALGTLFFVTAHLRTEELPTAQSSHRAQHASPAAPLDKENISHNTSHPNLSHNTSRSTSSGSRAATLPPRSPRRLDVTDVFGRVSPSPSAIRALRPASPPQKQEPPAAADPADVALAADKVLAESAKMLAEKPEHQAAKQGACLGNMQLGRQLQATRQGMVFRGLCDEEPALIKVVQRKDKDCVLVEGSLVPRQAVTAGSLLHPNLLRCLQYTVQDGALQHGQPVVEAWMALEWCGGGCLRDALLGGQFAAAEKAMEAGLQLTSALRALHEAGLVHGDLCGDCVWLSDASLGQGGSLRPAKALKLGGFGDHAEETLTVFPSHPALQRVTHAAPELLQQGLLSPACDVYSLGCLMWEMLHAQPLWVGLSQDAILARVAEAHEGPPFARHIPTPVQRLVMSCMAHAPAGRPSAAMLHQRLQGLLHILGPHQHQPVVREEQATPRKQPGDCCSPRSSVTAPGGQSVANRSRPASKGFCCF